MLAVEVGLAVAALLFIRRMADLHLTPHRPIDHDAAPDPDVLVYDLDRPLFFGDAQRFADTLHTLPDRRAVVLCMDSVTTLDVTAALALGEALADLRRRGVAIALCGMQPPVSAMLARLSVLPAEAEVRRFVGVEDAVAALKARPLSERPAA
ncbi:putative transporter [compost metagenome]